MTCRLLCRTKRFIVRDIDTAKKKNALWPFYFGNNGPLCIFRTRIWLMKSANWPFFFVVSDFIRFCQNEWIHCVSSNVYNVDRAKVYNRQIWGGSLNNSTIVIVFISMDSIHFDDHGHDSLSDRTALGIHFSRKILKKHSNWIEETQFTPHIAHIRNDIVIHNRKTQIATYAEAEANNRKP